MSRDRAGTILLVANYESDVGYAWWLMENFWHLIATEASARGLRCVLAYPRLATVPEIIATSPIDVVEFRFSYRRLGDIWRGLQFLRRHRIKSVYLTDWPYLHWVYLLWRLIGVSKIVNHDHTPGDRPPLTGLRAALKSLMHAPGLFSATLYVAVSPYIGQRMQENGRIPPGRCVVVTNGIRPFVRSAVSRSAVRQRIDIPDDAILIVLVSRATYYKGIDVAVRAMATVLEDEHLRGRVFAVHCGDGPDLAAFAALSNELGVARNFRFLGRRDDVREILSSADIALHPSHGEAMSLAILEFMSAELAVLVSDLPSVSTAVSPGVDGDVFTAGNAEAAARRLTKLIGDAKLRTRLGVAAAAACRERYSLETMNRTFVERVVPELLVATTS